LEAYGNFNLLINIFYTGTNILYKIRREELARGGQPSVRLMAKAFDSIEATVPKPQSGSKRSLFGIRKSRSVETTETGRSISSAAKSVLTPAAPSAMAVTVLGRNTSLSQIEELMGSQSPYGATLPRGGRNPFKNMGMSNRRELSASTTHVTAP
uniref:Movement protein n=1 Tax=Ascaris lumbricoides TaxID=6252 RepID=A0A0M3I3V2_ASCLU